jgi:2-polyprenyl-3-methyl-5-hydroxy-6-metoxy-1,4-benzoquinol methylase
MKGSRVRSTSGPAPRADPVGEELEEHNREQRRYFESADHRTLQQRGTRYLRRHLDRMMAFAGIRPGDRVLEVGCGLGRYTLLLAELGVRVEGLDLSPKLLEQLGALSRERLGYDMPLHAFDILDSPPELYGQYDAVIGFFILHHVLDVRGAVARAAQLVKPGGRVAFLEPNPFNPLYYVQITLTPEMAWRAERGILNMRASVLMPVMEASGLVDLRYQPFGFFPPFVTNRPWGPSLESVLERVPAWQRVLPFQLFGGGRP